MTPGSNREIHPENHVHHLASRLVDKETIATYIRLGETRNRPVLELILNKYLIFTTGAIEELHQRIARLEYRSVEELAHTMKSSAAQVGAMELSTLYQHIEERAEKHSLGVLNDRFFHELEVLQDDVTDALIYIMENPEKWLNSLYD